MAVEDPVMAEIHQCPCVMASFQTSRLGAQGKCSNLWCIMVNTANTWDPLMISKGVPKIDDLQRRSLGVHV